MDDLINSKKINSSEPKGQLAIQFSQKGLYISEDDQDWGSSGMNDIQKDSA